MNPTWKFCAEGDFALLAKWNLQLIEDEGHLNPMTVEQLEQRMRRWLGENYDAVVFSNPDTGEQVGYALYRQEPDEIYLRHLFVRRDQRSQGLGRKAIGILRQEIWPEGIRLTVEVLCSNPRAASFWRSVGYTDYSIALEIRP